MIAELMDDLSNFNEECQRMTYRRVLFPEPAMKTREFEDSKKAKDELNIRLPWIHNRDPVAFHVANMVP
jgi:hypothetical protein